MQERVSVECNISAIRLARHGKADRVSSNATASREESDSRHQTGSTHHREISPLLVVSRLVCLTLPCSELSSRLLQASVKAYFSPFTCTVPLLPC